MKKINKVLLELYEDRMQLLVLSIMAIGGNAVQSSLPHEGVNHASGWGIGIGIASLGLSWWQSNKANDSADDANDLAKENMNQQNEIARETLADQREEAAKLEKQKEIYRNIEFTNPYADVENAYADMENQFEGMENQFEGMENVYEDLTVNKQQAEFEAEQGNQSRANIMQSMQGAAGGSGIASLAQALANQGQDAARQASASIGQQERQNQLLESGESSRIDQLQRGEEGRIDQMQRGEEGRLDQLERGGEATAEMIRLGGEVSLEEREMNRQSTLLGMQMGQLSGANSAAMQAQQNSMSANAAQANLYGQQAANQSQFAGQMLTTGLNTASTIYSANQQ